MCDRLYPFACPCGEVDRGVFTSRTPSPPPTTSTPPHPSVGLQSAEQFRRERVSESERNEREGRAGDVDFQRMIAVFRRSAAPPRPVCVKCLPCSSPDSTVCRCNPCCPLSPGQHAPPGDSKITICARKRPVSAKELARKDYDAVTISNPRVTVHACKLKVDGITKCLDNQAFELDHVRQGCCVHLVGV
jgi:hypothetical protein